MGQGKVNVWEELLNQVAKGERIKNGTVIIVGDHGVGKKSLVNAFHKSQFENACKTQQIIPQPQQVKEYVQSKAASIAGLGYTFLEPYIEDDTTVKVSVWLIDEASKGKTLLESILPEPSSLSSTVAMIVVDLSKPWLILESIKKWVAMLDGFVQATVSNDPDFSPKELLASVEDYLRKIEISNGDISQFSAPNLQSSTGEDGTEEGKPELKPLHSGMLETNLGIPLIIVGTKSDVISMAAEDMETEMRLEFIQRHLRATAHKFGAGLTYTSARSEINVDLLYSYIMHRLYPRYMPMSPVVKGDSKQQPQEEGISSFSSQFLRFTCSSRDKVHIPAGWDRIELIQALASTKNRNIISWSSEDPFDQVVRPPVRAQSISTLDANASEEENALHHTDFLAKLLAKQLLLPNPIRASSGDAAAAALQAFNATASSMQTGVRDTTPATSNATSTAPTSAGKPATAASSSSSSSSSSSTGEPSVRRSVTAQDAKENPALIADFFQNLLNRDKTADSSKPAK